MIYDLLKAYRADGRRVLANETANTYYKRLCKLFEGQSITDTVNCLDMVKILDNLKLIKHKNYFSQTKNAFLHFCKFQNIVLSSDIIKSIEEIEKCTSRKYKKLVPVEYKEVDTTIKHIRNIKLKLSYQTIIATGLRVFELSQITPTDCNVTDDTITFCFTAKGGKTETVIISKSEYSKLFQRLTEHIKSTSTDKKLFYSAVYLQKQAKKLGFGCHDLRRTYAKLEYKKCGSKEEVKEKLRHSNMKNTNIYLNSKIKL